jgi:hypothetical protein
MNYDILVPITLLAIIFLVIRLFIDMQTKSTKAKLDTLAIAIEANKELPPDLWDKFLRSVDPKRNDYRKAILFGVIASSLLLLAWLVPFQDNQARYALSYVCIIPAVFSVVYFAFGYFGYQKE